ncbi:MAG: response regulator [Candidatus Neomarinimicrobiota bacterium]|jgi:DNA-binding response OmpR family regulator
MGNKRPTVIGVDNSPSMKKLLERSMENLDIDLTMFASAEEAWPYLQSNRPNLIVLSIILPGKNGLSLLRDLRQLPVHQETQAVIVSSKDYVQDRLVAKDLGALEFIPKPVSMQTITDVVVKYTQANLKNDNN